MKKALLILSITLIPIFIIGGCWRGDANMLNYNSYKAYSAFPNETYEEIGPLTVSGWAHYIGLCGTAARNALKNALSVAQARNGNALANVRWIYEGKEFKTPVCTDFFFIYYWGSKAQVSTNVINIKPMSMKQSGIYPFDKNKPISEESNRILAEIMKDNP
ncbi:MAG: hypothetical protein PHE84_04265 [bacterium]|nr:hypothetical protein [bacterium]